jgi:site-specific recombinase XerD
MPELCDRFLRFESLRGLTKNTVRAKKSTLSWLKGYFAKDHLDELKTVDGDRLADYLRASGLGGYVVHNTITELVRMVEWAYSRGLCYEPPWFEIPPYKQIPKGCVIPLEDIEAILLHSKEPYRTLFEMLYYCPRRVSELIELRWDQVFVGPEGRRIEWEKTKNGQPHIMPLVGKPLEIIVTRLKARSASPGYRGRLCSSRGCPYVFNYRGKQISSHYRYAWSAAKKAAGVDKRYRVHDLRVTWVVDARTKANLPREAIMACTGHTSEQVFMHYSRLMQSDVKPAYEAVFAARKKSAVKCLQFKDAAG